MKDVRAKERRSYVWSRLRLLIKQKLRVIPVILALPAILAPLCLHAGAWVREKGELYEKLSLSHFRADKTFSPKGNPKIAGPEFRETALSFYVEYGVGPAWTAVASLPFKSASSEIFGAKQSAAWFGDGWFLAKRRLLAQPVALAAQGGTKVPLGYDEADLPTLGQGQIDWELRLLFGKSFHPFTAYAGLEAGYRRRNGDYSDEIPYRAELGFQRAPFLLKLVLEGVDNRLNDEAGDITGFGTRSSFVFDQEYVKFSPSLIFAVSRAWSVETGYETVLDGGNTAAGQTLYFGVAWQGPLVRRGERDGK